MSYWAVVVAKNAEDHIVSTVNSILKQSTPPKQAIVVDDGSTDHTPQLLKDLRRQHTQVATLTLPDRGYDIRRVPANINHAWKSAELSTDYFMISGDDCKYPAWYASTLLKTMEKDPLIVVASGRPSSETFAHEHVPSGSGRMVKNSFWREIGEAYPVKAGWETWLLYKAAQEGFKVKLLEDLTYDHVRPRGSGHQFTYWGAAMHTLGYNPLYAMGRITKNILQSSMSIKGSMSMLFGYAAAHLDPSDTFMLPFDPSLRTYVLKQQNQRIRKIVSAIL